MPTYHVIMPVPLEVQISVEADSEAEAFAAITQPMLIDACRESAATLKPDSGFTTVVADMLAAGWEQATIEDIDQAQRDDQRVDDARDGEGGDQ